MTLPALTRITDIHLRVVHLEPMRAFYELLGFKVIRSDVNTVQLSATGKDPAILVLSKGEGARPRVPSAPGLFHVAYVLPDRRALAVMLRYLAAQRIGISGFADHLVSEAIYLSDPEGNGIELYHDRPRSEWEVRGGRVKMATLSLDVEGLLREAADGAAAGIPSQTTIGHIHLQVSDLNKAENFYHGILGFDVTERSYPGALFVSAGGYHHHVGLNIWNSHGSQPAPEDSAGLISFGIGIPDSETIKSIGGRVQNLRGETPDISSSIQDDDSILIELRSTAQVADALGISQQ